MKEISCIIYWRLKMFKFDWNDKEVINAAKIVLKKTSRKIAEDMEKDAKDILKLRVKPGYRRRKGRGLVSQFSIQESRFHDGSYIVWNQGPKNWKPPYHASFLEMGTYKDKAQPYMRPAMKKNKRRAQKLYQHELDKL